MSEQVEQVEVKRCGQDQMLFASTLMSYLTNESMKRLKLDFEAKEILMEDFVELMEEHLPESYFDFSFIMNLVNLFEEIDVNGDGGMEWDVCYSLFIHSKFISSFYQLAGIYVFYYRIIIGN
ncbi:MAG: hypothetical protein EZS28_036855 [Streblomastix strix]|uniref:EF-hand domain-containing protein n=1 Tax=Streblomastix strix TaxID=222440 RepID=A0A5J4UAU6_9EUKA|nr:MAG: hypothetical protein EZS28_036855 [Streblomastix strix]